MLLKSFGGHQLDTVGTCVLPTSVNGVKDSIPLEYYVIKDNVRPLLELESCLALQLISLNGKVEQIGPNINEVQQKPAILNEFRDVDDVDFGMKVALNSCKVFSVVDMSNLLAPNAYRGVFIFVHF